MNVCQFGIGSTVHRAADPNNWQDPRPACDPSRQRNLTTTDRPITCSRCASHVTELPTDWIIVEGRKSAHLIQSGTRDEFRGYVYAKTLCGRNVRVDNLVCWYGSGSICQTCKKRQAQIDVHVG
jgi:hypothetical protein